MLCVIVLICFASTSLGVGQEISLTQPTSFQPNLSPFVNYFLMLVQSSNELQNMFSSMIVEAKNYNALYNVLLQATIRYETPNPQSTAKTVADAVTSVLNLLTAPNLAVVISGAFDQLLKDNQLLTIDNASELAQQLANSFLEKYRVMGPGPAANIQVVADGGLEFLQHLNIETPKTAGNYARYLVKSFRGVRNFVISVKNP